MPYTALPSAFLLQPVLRVDLLQFFTYVGTPGAASLLICSEETDTKGTDYPGGNRAELQTVMV